MSDLEATNDAFAVTAVLSQGDHAIVTATMSWPKQSFNTWWRTERARYSIDVPSVVGSVTLPPLDLVACTSDTWSPTNQDVPDARGLQTAVWTGSEMIVWGGTQDGNSRLNTGGRYSPATDTWVNTSTGVDAPEGRYEHSAVWTGTEMIVWGGSVRDFVSPQDVPQNSGGRYDPTQDVWTTLTSGVGVPEARFRHTAVWTGTEMIVWGGQGMSSRLDTGGRYSPVSNSWMPVATGTNTPVARDRHTAIWTGAEMIIWGGWSSGFTNPITGGRYDPGTNSWAATSIGANVPAGRARHTAVWTGTEMIVWGGQSSVSDAMGTGARYEPNTDSWQAISTRRDAPTARIDHSALWTGTEMIVWGGQREYVPGSDPFENSGSRYDPTTDNWRSTSTGLNVPSARSSHSAVWTGTEMVVWGGGQFSSVTSHGGRYDPATDTWTPTAFATSPSGAWIHGAVWTGVEMIVWGGWDETGVQLVKTGGRYDPATDSWAPTSTGANAPAPGFGTMVWTGTEMIVWGGGVPDNSFARYSPVMDSWVRTSMGANAPAGGGRPVVWTGTEMIAGTSGGPVFTGALYNPRTDSWRPTSTTTIAPNGTSVWTGKELIVWGGSVGEVQMSTGARYNPTTDTWTPTSMGASLPHARDIHSAVWTGTEMIVWGGRYKDTTDHLLNTGGRYDPVADTWTPTSTGLNCPSARKYQRAVWSGTEMIVWGGVSLIPSQGFAWRVNSGARYNPATNSWTPTSTGLNVPAPRQQFSSVWTGTEMIVWGGQPWTATGGRYCACPSGQLVYRDADGDGLGDPGVSSASCDGSAPLGYVLDHTDCNDAIADASDSDQDGVLDACDLDDGLIYEWRDDKTSVSWQAEQGATSWNVYVGDLDVLKTMGVYTQVSGSNALAARQCDVSAAVASETGVPAPGKGSFSLVTSVSGGIEGTLGSSSAGPRPNANPCP